MDKRLRRIRAAVGVGLAWAAAPSLAGLILPRFAHGDARDRPGDGQ